MMPLLCRAEAIATRLEREEAQCFCPSGLGAEDAVALLFACLLLKKPFAPLNPKAPPELLAEQKRITQPRLVTPLDLENLPTARAWAWEFELNQQAAWIWTSGSTGKPKAACLTWSQCKYSAKGFLEFFGVKEGATWLLNLPLFHIAGVMIPIRAYLSRGTLVIRDDVASCDYISLVPTQLFRLLRGGELPEAKAILIGGAPLPRGLHEEALKRGLPISLTYGSTEACSTLTATLPGSLPRPGSQGAVLPYREVLCRDGQIYIGGKTRFEGYLTESGLVRAERYFATKDLGVLDEGELFVHGRSDDALLISGEKIDPRIAETALEKEFPDAVIHIVPREDSERGQVGVAVIWSAKKPYAIADIFLKGLWRPRAYYWGDLVAFAGGKLSRKASREALEKGQLERI